MPVIKRCLVVALLILTPHSALANDASLGRVGESVQPIYSTQVEMAAEEVTIRVTPTCSFVEASFTFRNQGPNTTVLMGFPQPGPGEGREEFRDDLGLHEFKTLVDGQEVHVALEKGLVPESRPRDIDYPSWHTWEVEFSPGQTRTVTNTYWVKNTQWSNGEALAGYVLVTGGTFMGPIGHARVTLVMEGILPYQIRRVQPGDFRFEGQDLVWEWRDLEPGADIDVFYDTRGLLPFAEAALDLDGRATQWEEWLSQGRHEEVLATLDETGAASQAALALYRARALEGLGRSAEAAAAWQGLLDTEGKDDAPLAHLAAPEALYHLALHGNKTGDREALRRIHGNLRESRLSAPLQRWVESLMPLADVPHESPVIHQAFLKPVEGDPSYRYLVIDAEDPDGDMAALHIVVWYEDGGTQHVILEQRLAYLDPYRTSMEYLIEQVPPGKDPLFSVNLEDAQGNLAKAGTLIHEDQEAQEDSGETPRPLSWPLFLAALLLVGALAAIRRSVLSSRKDPQGDNSKDKAKARRMDQDT
ncbi:MAG: hypothetical protein AB1576_05790 [Bacillota bacterium]